MQGRARISACRTIVTLVTALLGACSRSRPPSAASAEARAASPAPGTRDPCALVSRAEMETVLGPLAEPPYRVANRRTDPAGGACMYRARDLRNVTIFVAWHDGERYFRLFQGMGGALEDRLGGRNATGDSLVGNWDRATTPLGQLIVLKGDVAVHVDALGARLDGAGRAKIAAFAIARIGAPLTYDGAAAARQRPAAGRPGDPCALLTRAEVEGVMGPLRSDPVSSEDHETCRFVLTQDMAGRPFERALQVQWSDGFYALGQEREAAGRAQRAMRSAMGVGPGAVAGGQAEPPWDDEDTLAGGVIAVVKRDVLLKTAADGMYGFTRDRALALLRTAARRLP